MTDKVVFLREAPKGVEPASTVNASAVAVLEKWLDRAKRGEVAAIAVVAVLPNNQVTTDWSSSPPLLAFGLPAGALLLQAELAQQMMDAAREESR